VNFSFELFCMTLLALFIGLAVCFNGYRWFLILLPIFAFFWGFGLGAQTLQALFGVGFLATISSWVVGFIVGLIFAVLSYLFYLVGVAIVAFSFGYSIGVGFMGLIGLDLSFITWLVGVVVGVVVAGGTILLNIQKWVIIAITAFGGAGVIIGSLLFAFGVISPAAVGTNAVGRVLADSWFWLIAFLVLGVLGFASQAYTTRDWMLEAPESRI
jgi:hypothetical protein